MANGAIMETGDRQLSYEKQVLYYLLIFRKAMEEYGQWSKRAFASPRLFRDPQFQVGMQKLIEVIKTCGVRLQEMPHPVEGALDADRFLREMGKELEKFSESLSIFLQTAEPKERGQQTQALASQSLAIKQGYHQFFSTYEQIYPGRLAQTLRLIRQGKALDEANPQVSTS